MSKLLATMAWLTSVLAVNNVDFTEKQRPIGERLRMFDHCIKNHVVAIENDHHAENNQENGIVGLAARKYSSENNCDC